MSELSTSPRPFFLRILREPVLHFVVLGAALFAYGRVAPEAAPLPERHIEVTPADLARLQKNFEVFAGRAPQPEELEELVQDYVLDEILVQEALSRGLDKDDPEIRQRLRQKMERFFRANYPENEVGVPATPVMTIDGSRIRISASASVDATLSREPDGDFRLPLVQSRSDGSKRGRECVRRPGRKEVRAIEQVEHLRDQLDPLL